MKARNTGRSCNETTESDCMRDAGQPRQISVDAAVGRQPTSPETTMQVVGPVTTRVHSGGLSMGKQIRIYLADGLVSGVRHAEIANWTGQALACPRTKFNDLRSWDELRRPGTYLLIGVTEETSEDAVYIGESESVIDRLTTHTSSKEFWTELVAFTSKDDNLTKGHVRYLEARLCQLASTAGRYQVLNAAQPQVPALPRPDRDAMEEFLAYARILLGVLGHRVLDPYVTPLSPPSNGKVGPSSDSDRAAIGAGGLPSEPPIFSLRTGDLQTRAVRTDEGFVVLAGSQAFPTVQKSLTATNLALREKLIATGVLVSEGMKLRLTRDQLFNSPSQAAGVLVGYSISGPGEWRLPDGTRLMDYEATRA